MGSTVQLGTTNFNQIALGDLVGNNEENNTSTMAANYVGLALAMMLGVTDCLPNYNPVTCVPTSGMNVSFGGAGQTLYLGGLPADSIPSTPVAIAAADPTNPRIDLIVMQFNQLENVNHFTGPNMGASGAINFTADRYQRAQSMSYEYLKGAAAAMPVPPAVPTGYVAVFQITVPAAAGNIVSADIAYAPTLPTIAQALALVGATFVSKINGVGGAVEFDAGNGILITPNGPGKFLISNPSAVYGVPPAWTSKKVHNFPANAGSRTILINPSIVPPMGVFAFDIRNPNTQGLSNAASAFSETQDAEPNFNASGTDAAQWDSVNWKSAFDSILTSATLASNSRLLDASGNTLVIFPDDGSTHKLSAYASHSFGRSFSYTNPGIFPLQLIIESDAPAVNSGYPAPAFELDCRIIGGVNSAYGTNAGAAIFSTGHNSTGSGSFTPTAIATLFNTAPFPVQPGGVGVIETFTLDGNSSDVYYLTVAVSGLHVSNSLYTNNALFVVDIVNFGVHNDIINGDFGPGFYNVALASGVPTLLSGGTIGGGGLPADTWFSGSVASGTPIFNFAPCSANTSGVITARGGDTVVVSAGVGHDYSGGNSNGLALVAAGTITLNWVHV